MSLKQLLIKHRDQFGPILPEDQQFGRAIIIDCSQPLQPNLKRFQDYELEIGRYAEQRVIYDDYQQDEKNYRNIHLGIDLGVPEYTSVFTPFEATVHSFADNNQPGDYGPTIILQHVLDNHIFYTLYGHLSRQSLKSLRTGSVIKKGQLFATIGSENENGGWPSHLHFQVIHEITDDCPGNYPGICSKQELAYYLEQCPNPNILLNLPALKDE
ncbi:peptidoglycan DD-metalloendopeptidase family protein [Piscirickettsia litoralis]|uniref:Peptidase M23 n=1 Tax=Piscirickettsia litoralis TaxID=1891921 RepID=A0ABX3A4Y8_9GAMM|nr:peptidoglycan DD-metalloendopeptidase family protein [Piscirickettsia litoralis]ODN43936.1 peptidase M23 [Piscirickettsia litoralis]